MGLAAGLDDRCGAIWVGLFGKSSVLLKDLHFRVQGARPYAYNRETFLAIMFQAWLLLLVIAFAVDDHAASESR